MGCRVRFVKRWHVCVSLVMHGTPLSLLNFLLSRLQAAAQIPGENGHKGGVAGATSAQRSQRSQLAVAVSVDATSKLHYDYPKLPP